MSISRRNGAWRVRWRTLSGQERSQRLEKRSDAVRMQAEIRTAHAFGREWEGDKPRHGDNKTVRALRRLVADLRAGLDTGRRTISAEVPTCINRIGARLRPVPIHAMPPGVYFLIVGEEVVYVGQSLTPMTRVQEHMLDKHFDRAYLLPVPPDRLNAVETAFIQHLKPALNGSPGVKFVDVVAVLESYGMLEGKAAANTQTEDDAGRAILAAQGGK